MAVFEKNNKKGAGRPTGSKNKITQDIRETFKELLENNIHTIQNDLDLLEPLERLKMLLHLANFVIPKLKQQELKTDIRKFENFEIRDIYKGED